MIDSTEKPTGSKPATSMTAPETTDKIKPSATARARVAKSVLAAPDIARLDGPNLLTYYKATLLGLSQSTDPLISAIYADAQTRMKEPRHLRQLISAIDSIDVRASG